MKKQNLIQDFTELYAKLEAGGKSLPKDNDAEREVLGSLMFSEFEADKIFEVIGMAEGEEIPFYTQQHKLIFDTARRVIQKKEYPNPIAMWAEVRAKDLQDIIPLTYLTELAGSVVSTARCVQTSRYLVDLHSRRKLILQSELTALDGYAEKTPLGELLDRAETGIMEIRGQKKANEPVHLSKIEVGENILEGGYKSGLDGFDKKLHHGAGAQGGDFILLAARPSCGKTTFALNIAAFEAIQGNASLFFSLEMTKEQIAGKFFEYKTGIPAWRLNPKYRGATFSADEYAAVEKFRADKNVINVFIDDSVGLTPLDIRSRVARWKRKHKIQAVFVDYLQLIRPAGNFQNREREVSSISQSLKEMAKEFQLPFFVLTQLNRASGAREDKRLSLTDLRDSGSLEQDADTVVFLYDPLMADMGNSNDVRNVKLMFAKNRMGGLGEVNTQFDTTISTFKEVLNFPEFPEDKGKSQFLNAKKISEQQVNAAF